MLDILFLAFGLGREKAQQNYAAREVHRMINDEDNMRMEFFADQRKSGKDCFNLFGQPDWISGDKFSWKNALKMLDLVEEGYFPYGLPFKCPIEDKELKFFEIQDLPYKIIPACEGYVDLYLKLSDVEKYVGNRRGVVWRRYREMTYDQKDMFHSGKVTIGVPYGQGGCAPSQLMTIQEARDFMANTMEKRFQKYWKELKDFHRRKY